MKWYSLISYLKAHIIGLIFCLSSFDSGLNFRMFSLLELIIMSENAWLIRDILKEHTDGSPVERVKDHE